MHFQDGQICRYCFTSFFEKGITLKGKNLLPLGTNSFLLKRTPYQNRKGVQKSKQEVTNVFLVKKCRQVHQMY